MKICTQVVGTGFSVGIGLAALAAAVPSAQAGGQCYRYFATGPRYAVRAEQVLVRPATVLAHTVPGEYREVPARVLLVPARMVTRVIPPVYREVVARVLIEPAREIVRVVPPIEERIPEKVEVSPAHREWQVKQGEMGTVGCWVEVPASYATRWRTITLRPARRVVDRVPATYATQARTVEVAPARTVTEAVPAVYGTRMQTVGVSPPHTTYEEVPPEYRTVYRQVMIVPPQWGWAPIGASGACVGGAFAAPYGAGQAPY